MPSPTDNLDVITDHFDSLFHYADQRIVQAVIDKLGIERVFTDEALAEIADHYAWNKASRERRNAEYRAIAAERQSSLKAVESAGLSSPITQQHSEAA